ncbi:MAG TPA: hypothetical protein VIG32_04640 [Candidatus Baltobacteraceae bacterium]
MRRLKDRARRLLWWSLLLSVLIHFTIGSYLATLFFRHVLRFGGERAPIVVTAHVTIEHRPPATPRPQHTPQPRRTAVRTPRTIVVPRTANAAAAPSQRSAAPHRKELSHFDKRAPARLTAKTIAQQDAQFAKTIADAKKAINPVAGATSGRVAAEPPAHFKRDLSGIPGAGSGDGYLYPVKSWKDGGYDYYYVRYRVTYADGTPEEGIVPWPIRYLPGEDPFVRGIRRIPLPGPLADFQLAAGVAMQPLVAYCYAHRLPYCPIDHN